MTNSNNYCVIMGGGIGSRFWPYSRKNLPKQFLDFFGTGRSLIQQTFDRYKKIVPIENIFITTNVLYKELIQEQLPELDKSQILLEPTRRNTAPCIAWASYHIKKLNPNANVIVAPSDHLILKEDEFKAAILKGLEFVSNSPQLLTLGIKPNRPETGYGYIQIEEEKQGEFFKVKTFIEKPQLEFAKVFVESGEFYWNSGIFLWNINTILKAFNEIMPEVCTKLTNGEEDFASCPNISIDYGIMEKAFIAYFGSTGTPSVYLDRNKDKFSVDAMGRDGLLSAIKSKAEVAIAIKNSLSEDKKQVELTAVIGSKKSFNGKVIAALVEDGMYLNHVSLGMIEWFHTMRDYMPSFEGEEAVAFEPGAPKEIKFQLNMGKADPVKSTLVVFVTKIAFV